MKETRTTFPWLNATQFLGALNDNVFKFLIIFFLIGILGEENSKTIAGIAGIVFVIPFLLFSHAAGILADRFSKRTIIVSTKIAEIVIMIIGAAAFLTGAPIALYGVVFLMAAQSAFFGPSKYGIIPELVTIDKISKANSFLVSFSFLAIIIGTGMAPSVSRIVAGHFELAGIICSLIAVAGFLCSLKIKKTEPVGSTQKFTPLFILDIWKTFKFIAKDRHLLLAVLGTAYFLLIGAYVQLNIIGYGIETLNLSKESGAYLFLLTAFGIGTGSFLAGKLSGRNIEFGIVPLGSVGITITSIMLYFICPDQLIKAGFLVFFMGLSAGLFIVPLESFIQFKSPKNRRGEILASSNFLSFVGVSIASLMIIVFSEVFGFSAAKGFLIIGLLNFILMLVSLVALPDFLLRFIALVVMRLFYKIDIHGIQNIPVNGPALLISNHASWVDALLIQATSQRRIRFMMERNIYSIKWLNPLFRLMKIVPVSFSDPPKKILEAIKEARSVLDQGFLLCVFAEGQITRSGNFTAFHKGFERIMKGADFPVIPTYIAGAWGSIFSYYFGKPLSRLPYMIPYPVKILFGDPLPPESKALDVRLKVMELGGKMFDLKKTARRSLSTQFIKVARQNWFAKAVCESSGKKLSFGKTVSGVVMISRKIRQKLFDQENIGVLLPPSAGGIICNIAITLAGKVPVNINFTAGNFGIQSSIKQCRIKKIITSRLVLKKLKDFPVKEGLIYLEDWMKEMTFMDKIVSLIQARFFPCRLIDKNPVECFDKTATIIFSSGSTAEPKGIMLSHHNIASNVESLRMILKIGNKDNLMASLPFFHSFGYTGSIWFPLLSGFSVTFHSNPLESTKIVSLIKKNRSTILVATPTFLMSYMRKASKEDFKSLRYVIVGAAKLGSRTAQMFIDKYGIQPLEGYGATELSPMASVNIPDIHIHGVNQIGTKMGTVGHPLPGITALIVDPETRELLKVGEEGLLLIKGPNVMKGYLNQLEKTREVLKDGFYNTGDIASMDSDGFLTIKDRLSRFSKIGGEMVPHIAIEETYHNALDTPDQVLVVTSVPDEKKGEQLVVLYVKQAGNAKDLHQMISGSDLPNLWKPKKENYILIEALPLLGSGKLDLKKIKQLAKENEK